MRAFRPVFRTRHARAVAACMLVALAASTLLLAACGKATVKSGMAREGFVLTDLQSGISAVIVDAGITPQNLSTPYRKALAERFGDGDSLSSHLAARLIDSLNGGTPRVTAVGAPGLNPRHIIHIRELTVSRVTREVPTALLPTGGQQSMQAAGGGASESWAVSFEVDVWRPTGLLGNAAEDTSAETASVPDSATSVREYSFSVTGRADVPLYAYKTALVEAVNAAAAEAARHLRGGTKDQ